ncbi:MAG: pyridoxal phosphate-dependent aminotransferase [Oscillospiraceae bacterium]|nr:pyridoxal phosphate-dependent aminotransferase [Oscillospiraceae bacterium]
MLSESSVRLGTARSVIRELFEYGKTRAAEVGAENVFDFSLGNPSVEPPAEVTETALRLLRESDPVAIHGYTSAQGDTAVREKLAASLNRRFAANCGPDDLYVCTGAAGALCGTLHGLACPGDEFVVFAPFFPEYRVFIEKTGAAVRVVPPQPADFQIDFDALASVLSPRTKGVLVNSPNNPSGAVYSRETLTRLAALLSERAAAYGHPIYLISDEPYREVVYDGFAAPWIPSLYRDTVVCYSFSKSLSLPGERLGYVFVPKGCGGGEPVLAAVAGASRAMGYVSAPSLFQRVCAECCDLTADLSVYAANRRLLLDGLRACGFTCVEPGGTFCLFPQTLEPDDRAFCEAAKRLDLLLVPGSGFGCPGHARLSYCVPTARVERALPVFEKLARLYR